jgi:hypothetical protein
MQKAHQHHKTDPPIRTRRYDIYHGRTICNRRRTLIITLFE